jgi:4a-hydroxytetrahydrobiopterin dehydratase
MPTATALTAAQVTQALGALPGWTGTTGGLVRTYRFTTFKAAIAYMQAGVDAIDRLDHHPEWTNVYNRITVQLRTHDAGNQVTALDVQLAVLLDHLAAEHHAV